MMETNLPALDERVITQAIRAMALGGEKRPEVR
jgi:hypothetical protein